MLLPNKKQQTNEETLLYLEKEGARYTKDIAKAVKQVPWVLKALQLIWTAGPVTYIALQGGYFMGYGKQAPWQIFVYFAGYTLIAGFIGLGATIAYNLISKPKQDNASRALLKTISQLTELLAFIRDLKLLELDLAYRKIEGTRLILENTHAETDAIRLAIKQVTNDDYIADKAAEIDIYRRAGLLSRIKDTVQEIKTKSKHIVAQLNNAHPHLSTLLKQRLSGKSPTLQEGLPRNEHFIRRLLLANEEENELLITPRDIEEMIILTIEFLAGREFSVLTFKYSGRKKLCEAHDRLEQTRKAYYLSLTSCRSRIKALHVFLTYLDSSQIAHAPFTIPIEEQIKQCFLGIENLYRSLSNENTLINQKTCKKDFKKALILYNRAYEQLKRIQIRKAAFREAIKEWEKLSSNMPDAQTALKFDRGHGGLTVSNKLIRLTDEQIIEASFTILDTLEPFLKKLQHYKTELMENEKTLSIHHIKPLAVNLAVILSEYIPLQSPLVQYAIENSPATNMLSLEIGLSAKTKVGFLSAMICEIDNNEAVIAYGFAKGLVQHYGLTLNQNTIEFLEENYNADRMILLEIQNKCEQYQASPALNSDKEIYQLKPPEKTWLKLAQQIN